MKIQLQIGFGILIAAVALYLYFQLSQLGKVRQSEETTIEQATAPSKTETATPSTKLQNPYDTPDPADPRITRLKNGNVLYNPSIEASRSLSKTIEPKRALETIHELIDHYRFAYQENPVGVENFEFTEQLLGKNRLRIVFIDPESEAIQGNQLVDTWGTPYFFHPLSGQKIEIRSAGPDRQFWTNDDIQSANSSTVEATM